MNQVFVLSIFGILSCTLTRVGLTTERLQPTQDYALPSRFSIGLVCYNKSSLIMSHFK